MFLPMMILSCHDSVGRLPFLAPSAPFRGYSLRYVCANRPEARRNWSVREKSQLQDSPQRGTKDARSVVSPIRCFLLFEPFAAFGFVSRPP
jgi:hypothetical protein